jgi:hypothetical protein
MHQGAEIGSIREMLTLATSHVNDLNDLILVESVEGSANILDVVGSQSVVAVLTVQTKETYMMSNGSLSVQLSPSLSLKLTISLRA